MCEVGLEAKVRQRRPYVSYNGTISHIADNRLDRNFTPDKPNTTFVSDVTEFRVAGRKVYLTPVMDLCDRSIVAHAVATSPSTAFTAASLQQAITACAPEPGWMMHTDQGFQYQHSSWRNLIHNNVGVQSMSRNANCYDNAVMEKLLRPPESRNVPRRNLRHRRRVQPGDRRVYAEVQHRTHPTTTQGPHPDAISESDPRSPNRLELNQSNFRG